MVFLTQPCIFLKKILFQEVYSNLSTYTYVSQDFTQAVKANRKGKTEIRIHKLEPEKSFISRNLLTTAKTL
jgi:hypothetical protein